MLNLDSAAFDTGFLNKRINRSLTLAEYEIQRQFNLHFSGGSSSFISDPLVNDLPEVASQIPRFSREAYNQIVEKHQRAIEAVNALIGPEEAVKISPFDPLKAQFPKGPQADFTFTSEQLGVLARSLSNKLGQIPAPLPPVPQPTPPAPKTFKHRVQKISRSARRKLGL